MQEILAKFSFGEIADTAAGNVTAEFYASSMKQGLNFWMTKDASASRRWGTGYVEPTWGDQNASSEPPLLFPFRSTDAAYILEFSAKSATRVRLRIFDEDGNLIGATGTAPDIYTLELPAANVDLYNSPDFVVSNLISTLDVSAGGDEISVLSGSLPWAVIKYTPGGTFTRSYVELNGNPWLRKDLDPRGDFTIKPDGTTGSETARVKFVTGIMSGAAGGGDGGGVFYDNSDILPMQANLDEGHNTNNIATLDFDPANLCPYKNKYAAVKEWIGKHVLCLINTGAGDYSLIEISRVISGNRLMGIVKQTGHGNAHIGVYMFFWPPVLKSLFKVQIIDSVSPFGPNDKGLSYMIDDGSGIVYSVVSSTIARLRCVRQGLVANPGAALSGTSDYEQDIKVPDVLRRIARPAWGNNVAGTYPFAIETGWPALSCYFENRLILARSKAEPQSMWGSKAFNTTTFCPGPDDNEAFSWEMASEENGEITAIAGTKIIFVATRNRLMRAVTTDGITPTNFRLVEALGYGFAKVKPVKLGTYIGFVRNQGNALIAVRYNDAYGNMEDADMTQVASHVSDAGIVQLTSAKAKELRLYALRGDGNVAIGTFLDQPALPSWTSMNTPGGTIESVAVMEGFRGDQIWMSVKRTINGQTRRYLERMIPNNFLDCSVGIDKVTITSEATGKRVSGLGHLEGQTITVMLAGSAYPDLTVTSGSVLVPNTTAVSYEPFLAGLPYKSKIVTHRVAQMLRDGTDQGRNKAIKSIGVRVKDTRHLLARTIVNEVEMKAEPFVFKRTNTPMDSMRPAVSGNAEAKPETDYDTEGYAVLETDMPWDATISMVKLGVDFQNGTPVGPG